MKWAWVLLVAVSLTVFAGESKKIQIQSFDPNISAKDFGENYEDRNLMTQLPYPSTLPEKGVRDVALKNSGVLEIPKYAKMDDLDRDLMFLKAKRRTVVELKKVYPDIPDATLKRLKKEALK